MGDMTMDSALPSSEGEAANGGITMETGMGHTHAGCKEANIYPIGVEREQPVFMGCFSWQEGEDVEKRWDEFAARLWSLGLQPPEDEPTFSINGEDGVTYDHYYLVSIYEDEGM